MGELDTTLDISHLPSFADLDPEQCYLGWQLCLKEEVSRESLDEVLE